MKRKKEENGDTRGEERDLSKESDRRKRDRYRDEEPGSEKPAIRYGFGVCLITS